MQKKLLEIAMYGFLHNECKFQQNIYFYLTLKSTPSIVNYIKVR